MEFMALRGAPEQNDQETLREHVERLEVELARRERVELSLQRSEERYRALLEAINEGLAILNEESAIVYVNDTFADMVGYRRQELTGRPFASLVDATDLPACAEAMRLARPSARFELSLCRADGQKAITLASPSSIIGPDGVYRGGFIVFTDITVVKQAESALAKERNLLRALMDSIPDYAYIKDRKSRFVSTNTAHLRVLNAQTTAEVAGKTDFDFFPPELARQYYEDEQQVMSTGEPLVNKIEQVVDRAGNRVWVMSFKAPLHDDLGRVVGLVGISRDVTALRGGDTLHSPLRLIIENARDMAYKLDLRTKTYEYVSPSAKTIAGYAPDEIERMGLQGYLEQVHPDDRAALVAYHDKQAAATRQDTPAVIEYRFRHKDGPYRWFAQSTTVLFSEDNKPVAEVGTIRDITQGKMTEQAVRAALRMEATSTLAGGIAHEFNNLMVGVLGNAELLQMRLDDDPKISRMLQTIATSAQKAAALAQQMLAFARGGKYQPAVVDLNTVVEDTLAMERKTFPARVGIERKLEGALWKTRADPAQIGQVLVNLLMNAVEAIEDKGRAVIATQNIAFKEGDELPPGLGVGQYVCLSVTDNGPGVKPELHGRVFEPFFTTKFQGRGLGLAAAYGIVKNHGGSITVNGREGEGAIFRVYLPVYAEKETPQDMVAPIKKASETILVVDDEELVRNVTASLLDKLGYNVICARNGKEGLAALKENPKINLVLLDMAMPVMDGAQVFHLMKKERPGLKVIICSGYQRNATAQELLDAGADFFLQKPFRAKDLAIILRNALDRPAKN
jgi:PAS domain S-box-containing protein